MMIIAFPATIRKWIAYLLGVVGICSDAWMRILVVPIPRTCKCKHVFFRGLLDGNAKLQEFAEKLEAACIDVVEGGTMTKDLAILSHGPQ